MWPHLPNMKHSQRFWNFHIYYLELWPTAQQHLKFSWRISTDWSSESKACIMGLRDITDCSTVCSLLALCEVNPLKISGFPSQRASNAENFSMSLRLDDVLRLVPNVTHLSLVCHRAPCSFHSIFCFMGSWPKALTCLYHLRKMIMVIDEIKIFRGIFIYKSSMVLWMFKLFLESGFCCKFFNQQNMFCKKTTKYWNRFMMSLHYSCYSSMDFKKHNLNFQFTRIISLCCCFIYTF